MAHAPASLPSGDRQRSAKTRLTRRFTLPIIASPGGSPLPERDRMTLLGQVITDQHAPLRSRAAAAILLLYAQPVSRITRLTLDDVFRDGDDDVLRDGDQALLRLGDPPSPVPKPVAALLLEYVGQRTNMRTATNRGSRWLFPGRRAGEPLQPSTLSTLVQALGVPSIAGRAAAIRQHVLDMPAPIVATALGYHHVTTTRLAAGAGTTWANYAPGDHGK